METTPEAGLSYLWKLNLIFIDVFSGLVAPPSTVVVVRVGTEAVLPCHLGQGVNSSTLRMEWMRSDLSPGFVFVWVEGRERLEHKLRSYLQRTSVLFSGMKLGYVFLQLTNVTALDEGTYICRAPRLRQRCSVQLLAFASSPPAVSVVREVGHTAELWCESAGWHPKPDVSWLDETGEPLPAERVETLRDADGLFRVSSRVLVDKRRSNSATCRLQTQSIAQSREACFHIRGELSLIFKCVQILPIAAD
uniref:Ig-like domain-containing protein n=1 Tax=Oryzias sinensis TaxID=183150 RepID=A0A8C7Y3F2_9TELE